MESFALLADNPFILDIVYCFSDEPFPLLDEEEEEAVERRLLFCFEEIGNTNRNIARCYGLVRKRDKLFS